MRRGAERKENLRRVFGAQRGLRALGGGQGLFDFVRHAARAACRIRRGGPVPQTAHASQGVRIMSHPQVQGPGISGRDPLRTSRGAFSRMDFQSSVLVHPQLRAAGRSAWTRKGTIQYPTVARQALERHAAARGEGRGAACAVRCDDAREGKARHGLHTQANATKPRRRPSAPLSDCPVLPEAVDSGKCMGDWIMLPLLQRSEAASLRELAGQNGEGTILC